MRDERRTVGSPPRTGQTRWSDCPGVRVSNLVLVAPVHLINTVSARSNRAIWKMMMQALQGFAPDGACSEWVLSFLPTRYHRRWAMMATPVFPCISKRFDLFSHR